MSKIEDVYNACNPTAPLQAGDPKYVSCGQARGGEDVVRIFSRRIRRSTTALCQLFVGHSGVGKSTELLRLKAELEKTVNREKPYFVVYFKADDDIDLNDVEFTDLLLAILGHLADRLSREGIALKPGWLRARWEEIKGVLQSPVELQEVEITAGLLSLKGIIKNSPDSRAKIRKAMEPHLSSLIDETNQLLLEVRNRILKKGYQDLVVIVDNLETVTLRIVDPQTGITTHDLFFIERAHQLQALRCHVVYTIPISLAFSQKMGLLQARFPNTGPRLPMIKITEANGAPFDRGIGIMRDILERRFREAGTNISEVFESETAVKALISASGGHPRHLLTIFRSACDHVDNIPITQKAVDRAIQSFANSFASSIPEEHWALLSDVYRTKKIKVNVEHQKMLYNLIVLEYLNADEPWYDVHPVVQRLGRFRELAGGTRKAKKPSK